MVVAVIILEQAQGEQAPLVKEMQDLLEVRVMEVIIAAAEAL